MFYCKNKQTGEYAIVLEESIQYNTGTIKCSNGEIVKKRQFFDNFETINVINEKDWEERRFNMAKDLFLEHYKNESLEKCDLAKVTLDSQQAIDIADRFITAIIIDNLNRRY